MTYEQAKEVILAYEPRYKVQEVGPNEGETRDLKYTRVKIYTDKDHTVTQEPFPG
jgi:hypothetical protein